MKRAAWVTACLLAGCGRFGFDQQDANSSDGTLVDAAGYHPVVARFAPAGGDYLATGMLSGVATGPRGTFSAWFRFGSSGDGQEQYLLFTENGLVVTRAGISRTAGGLLRFDLPGCFGTKYLDMSSRAPYSSASGWIHILAAWDVSIARAELYVNDAPATGTGATVTNGNICYTAAKWGVGGIDANKLDAEVADLFGAVDAFVDIALVGERRKFIDDAGKPVPLGVSCTEPLGKVPSLCLSGAIETWHTNTGTAGGFALAGDGLDGASSNPAD